jgi:hypothetical protein
MKYIIILLCIITGGYSAEWNDQTLPMAKPDKPVYQWTGWPPPGNMWLGGGCHKVRIPTTEDLKKQLEYEYELKLQAIRLAEINRGSWLFMIGLVAAGIGCACHFITAYPVLQRLSEWIIAGGLACSVLGLVIKKAAEYQNLLVLGAVVLGACWFLYSKREWSVSHLGKWLKGKKDVTK